MDVDTWRSYKNELLYHIRDVALKHSQDGAGPRNAKCVSVLQHCIRDDLQKCESFVPLVVYREVSHDTKYREAKQRHPEWIWCGGLDVAKTVAERLSKVEFRLYELNDSEPTERNEPVMPDNVLARKFVRVDP